jgi:signal transduction histidine kinase
MFKRNPPQVPEFRKIAPAFRKVSKGTDHPFEHFAGREAGPIHNAAGCRLSAEVVLVRTYAADPYVLAIKLGDSWFELAKISHDDPAIQALAIVEHGKSPAQIRADERRAEAERQRLEAEEAERQRVREHYEERRRLGEERRRLAREANHQSMGW